MEDYNLIEVLARLEEPVAVDTMIKLTSSNQYEIAEVAKDITPKEYIKSLFKLLRDEQ